jgi:prepilin-type N-terminal cleavage/methylation domain-containing protein
MLKREKGFTLIELLVVIAIIGTLSGIVLVSLGGARARARDAQRYSDMRQIVTAQELYYGLNEAYFASGTSAAGTPAISTYLPGLNDPLSTMNYNWVANEAGDDLTCNTTSLNASGTQWFCAYAALEASDEWVAASHTGVLTTTAAPTTDTACTCFAQ